MTQLDRVEAVLRTLSGGVGVTAGEVAGRLELSRSTASRYLNALTQRKRAVKQPGRPVRYLPAEEKEACPVGTSLIRPDGPEPEELFSPDTPGSLQPLLREAMAAVMYPPHGLPLLLHGETGVGKSHLAHTLYRWVLGKGRMGSAAPYISFNCADYAQNPDLLLGQLFGVKRGAYTGASDRPGLVERAAGGILFLDEIHRLPPAGQEMLFHLIDQGRYRRLGETEAERISRPLLIGATTEDPSSVLLPALLRRFALRLTLPPLRERTREERERLLDHFLRREAKEMRMPLAVDPECRRALLTYDCRGNTGQLRSDIQTACARAFLRRLHHGEDRVVLRQEDLPEPAAAVLKQTSSPGDESASAPLPPRQPASPSSLYGRLTLLARELEERGLSPYEKIRRLQELADRHLNADPSPSEQRWTDGLIDADLMKWVRETAAAILSDGLSPRAMTALGLHIQALLTEGRPPARPSLPPGEGAPAFQPGGGPAFCGPA